MFFVPITFCFCYLWLMFIKTTNNKDYEALFNINSTKPGHIFLSLFCIFSSLLMICNVIRSFPFETICLLVVMTSHYAFKSKVLIKNKVKSFLKNMLND